MRLRRVMCALLAPALLGPAVAACGDAAGTEDTLTVLGPWIDDPGDKHDEHDVFTKVISAYADRHHLTIDYRGTRAIDQALRAKVKDGTLPDIAILPTVGELATSATEDLAKPVTSIVRKGQQAPEGRLAADHRALWRDRVAYAVAIKTDVKSLITYQATETAKTVPTSLDAGMSRERSWCIGLNAPAEPAWPGTDWIEDLLLQKSGVKTYEQMASGTLQWSSPPMKQAWTAFAQVLTKPSEALLTTPQEAAGNLMVRPASPALPCLLHQSSFWAPDGTRFVPSGPRLEVSSDFAARFTDKQAAVDLLRFLATDTAWAVEGAGKVVPVDPNPYADPFKGAKHDVATTLIFTDERCLDASDAMPATMAAAFQTAVLEFVADGKRLDHLDELLKRLDAVRDPMLSDYLSVRCTS